MSGDPSSHGGPGMARRRSPRLLVEDRLTIRLAGRHDALTLHDISFQGFSTWGPTRIVRGEVFLFLLGASGQDEQLIEAVSVHVGPWPPLDARGQFTGWFVESETGQAVLEAAVENLTQVLSFPEAESE